MYSPVILEVLKKTKISARQACGSVGICEWQAPPDVGLAFELPKFDFNFLGDNFVLIHKTLVGMLSINCSYTNRG